jgi:hypothetical protein
MSKFTLTLEADCRHLWTASEVCNTNNHVIAWILRKCWAESAPNKTTSEKATMRATLDSHYLPEVNTKVSVTANLVAGGVSHGIGNGPKDMKVQTAREMWTAVTRTTANTYRLRSHERMQRNKIWKRRSTCNDHVSTLGPVDWRSCIN